MTVTSFQSSFLAIGPQALSSFPGDPEGLRWRKRSKWEDDWVSEKGCVMSSFSFKPWHPGRREDEWVGWENSKRKGNEWLRAPAFIWPFPGAAVGSGGAGNARDSQVSELCLLDSLGILTHSAPPFSHPSPDSIANLLGRLSQILTICWVESKARPKEATDKQNPRRQGFVT